MEGSSKDAQVGADAGKSQPPKTLKFVVNEGGPQIKRRRIGAACLTCRKRKTACSGERPACDTCGQNNLECLGYTTETTTALGHKRTTSEGGQRAVKRDRESAKIDPDLQATPNAGTAYASASRPSMCNQQPTRDDSLTSNPRSSLFSGPRNRMPYFRWLGPTAIMPGFKQMVVKVKRTETELGRSSTHSDGPMGVAESPAVSDRLTARPTMQSQPQRSTVPVGTPTMTESDIPGFCLPSYDTRAMPPSELITHLAQTFFTHLGCNYPFLQRERFLRDLEEKQVDAILVDAVCALAARFSKHSLLTQQFGEDSKPSPAEHGHVFAQRAKIALIDTYACPSVSAVQAALLLAYLEFGESRDSGLWMYLGIAIRMAQDLGMHKLEGLRYKGKTGPTPKAINRQNGESPNSSRNVAHASTPWPDGQNDSPDNASMTGQRVGREEGNAQNIEEQQSVEQERIDTLWAVFLLDRVVSSGTGRRCMLRDKDIEVSFPALDTREPKTGWPAPFPALIRIVHLYGRVADLLNSIKEPSDVTRETPKRLASMESQVTELYQGLSAKLHFDAVNFQHYMKAGEGTNFVLLHFWFHLLIVLLHQPTLLKTFEGGMLQLFPNSQQLSMSSAKTIADILSYSQLIDAKAFLGNPFTSQPIYIAACAFLKEIAEQTASSNQQSRASSPPSESKKDDENVSTPHGTAMAPVNKRMSISELANSSTVGSSGQQPPPELAGKVFVADQRPASTLGTSKNKARHTLLATAATQHYQLCSKALQSLETYWCGAKYILTVLDQKFQGVRDPLLYTAEEGECSMERPRPEPAFTRGWRRKSSWDQYSPGNARGLNLAELANGKESSRLAEGGSGAAGKAIGWTMTGTMGSTSTNLAMHYPTRPGAGQTQQDYKAPQSRRAFNPITNQYDPQPQDQKLLQRPLRDQASSTISVSQLNGLGHSTTAAATSDADLLLNLHSPYSINAAPSNAAGSPALCQGDILSSGGPQPSSIDNLTGATWDSASPWDPSGFGHGTDSMQPLGDMMIECQDVEMNMLGLDMMPWFDSFAGDEMLFQGEDARQSDGGARFSSGDGTAL